MDESHCSAEQLRKRARSRLVLRTLAITVFSIDLLACSRTFRWSEDVSLVDGQVTRIERAKTRGLSLKSGPGWGALEKVSIQFDRRGQRVRWTHDQVGEIWETPVLLTVVDEQPVVVFPVTRVSGCKPYGYPPEGVVAERFDGKTWRRWPIDSPLKSLRLNLFLDISPIQDGEHIQSDYKRNYITLDEAVSDYADEDGSCAKLKPPHDPEREAREARAQEAALKAPSIDAELIGTTEPVRPRPNQLHDLHGRSLGSGYVSAKCGDLLDAVSLHGTLDANGSTRNALTLRWNNAALRQISLFVGWVGTALVECDRGIVFVGRENGPGTLLVYRFTEGGEPVDAVQVRLPGAVAGSYSRAFAVTEGEITVHWCQGSPYRDEPFRESVYKVALPAIAGP